jgi:hypothetical protein
MKTLIAVVAAVGALAFAWRSDEMQRPAAANPSTAERTSASRPAEHLEVPPPPFSEGIFPCSFCHAELKTNRTRRVVEAHSEIVLKHDEEHRWCLDCHDGDDRDVLHLADGEKYRDWRAGVHGRRTGQWNGQKTYLLCVHCHSPHQPHFKAIAPKPAPRPPSRPGR